MVLPLKARSIEAGGNNPDAWFTPGRYAIILGVLIFAAYPDVVSGVRTFFFQDFGLFGYPLASYHRQSFWQAEIPLWNPLSNCGLPFLAQWNTLVLYPGSLFYLLFPLSWSLGVFCLLHQFWAGLGMYFLAWRWTANRFAAAVAGVVFAFNGLTTNCLMWPNNIAALGWMPWVVLAVEGACVRGGARPLLRAALFGACQMLAGAPEIFLLTWLLLSAILLIRWIGCVPPRWNAPVRFASVVVLIALLSMVQWLPFSDLLAHSHRDENFANTNWSMPPWGWANFLVPAFRCFPRQGILFQDDQYWTSSYYFGIGMTSLVLCAPATVKNKGAWLMAGTAVIGSVLALGKHGYFYSWLREWFPQMGYVRFPIKFVALTEFAAPLLAAFALGQFSESLAEKAKRTLRLNLGVSLVLSVIVGIIGVLSFFRPMEGESWKTTAFNALARGVCLALTVGAVVSLVACKRAGRQLMVRLALLAVTWFDLATHTPRQNPTIPPGAYASGFAALSPKPVYPHSRALLTLEAENALRRGTTENPQKDFFFYRRGLFDNVNLLEGIAQVHGFYSLYLRETDRIRQLFASSSQPTLAPLADFLGVSQISAPGKFIDWESRTNYLPLLTAGQTPVFADAGAVLQRLTNPAFNPAQTVLLPPEARSFIHATNATTVKIAPKRFESERIEFQTQTDAPAMIVLAQSYYHPWRAYVDEERAALWRANYAFQALEVPAGQHDVKLRYEDRKFSLGALISWTTALSCLAARLGPWRARSRTRPDQSTHA